MKRRKKIISIVFALCAFLIGWLPEGTEFVTKYDIPGGESYIYTDETELLINFLYSSDPDSVYYLKQTQVWMSWLHGLEN